MNNFVLGACLTGLFLFTLPAANAAQGPRDVAVVYFNAMQNGDVVTLKSCMSGRLYEKRKILLEQNAGYPEFLRKYYAGADIQIAEARDGVVKVMAEFPDGSIHAYQLVVEQAPDGNWLVTDEISRDR